ncbi:MAG: SURF1 family protein [Bdellovibrionota bacterium]|nr:MAG: SURF1 family protein [Bdellovibrionota bacterium]
MAHSTRHLWLGGVLIVLSLLAANWQWGRHKQKVVETGQIVSTLALPAININELPSDGLAELQFRRVQASGRFDYEHEFVLRNRRLDGQPGVFVVTPLLLDDTGRAVLVNRGFIPLAQASREKRKLFRGEPSQVQVQGIVRKPMRGRLFGPQDPQLKPGDAWRDTWLRIDPDLIRPLLPYPLLPVFVEMTASGDPALIFDALVEKKSGRDELLNMSGRADALGLKPFTSTTPLPAHVLLPPDIHRGYVVEWIFIACFIAATTLVVHLRKSWGSWGTQQSLERF